MLIDDSSKKEKSCGSSLMQPIVSGTEFSAFEQVHHPDLQQTPPSSKRNEDRKPSRTPPKSQDTSTTKSPSYEVSSIVKLPDESTIN